MASEGLTRSKIRNLGIEVESILLDDNNDPNQRKTMTKIMTGENYDDDDDDNDDDESDWEDEGIEIDDGNGEKKKEGI